MMTDLHFYDYTPTADYQVAHIDRILQILRSRGYNAPRQDIRLAWAAYSDEFCASWLNLPESDDEIFNNIMRFLKC